MAGRWPNVHSSRNMKHLNFLFENKVNYPFSARTKRVSIVCYLSNSLAVRRSTDCR